MIPRIALSNRSTTASKASVTKLNGPRLTVSLKSGISSASNTSLIPENAVNPSVVMVNRGAANAAMYMKPTKAAYHCDG